MRRLAVVTLLAEHGVRGRLDHGPPAFACVVVFDNGVLFPKTGHVASSRSLPPLGALGPYNDAMSSTVVWSARDEPQPCTSSPPGKLGPES